MSVTDSVLPNPDRGYAGWEGADMINSYDSASVTARFSAGDRLLSCEIDGLSAFRTSAISSSWLSNFQSRLDAIRAAGMKCAINLRYDNSGGGNDATADQIVAHLAQLKPIFQKNADILPFAKAGFIGAWGEWHSSQNNNACFGSIQGSCTVANANRLRIRNALMDAFHPRTYVHFRFPDDQAIWFPTVLAPANAFTDAVQARAAFHNDCQLSSSNDTGTWVGYSSGWSGSSMQTYMATLTDLVPYGGEVSGSCAKPLKTDCATARSEFAKYHLAWLKDSLQSTDSTAYRDGWTAGGCMTEIRNLMGYRLQLDSVTSPRSAVAGQTLSISVKLRNVGWARVFSPRVLTVQACLTTSPFTCFSGKSAEDLRSLPPQASTSSQLTVPVSLPLNATPGSYELRLSAPDIWPSTATTAAFAIRFANSDQGLQGWNSAGYFKTGSFVTVK